MDDGDRLKEIIESGGSFVVIGERHGRHHLEVFGNAPKEKIKDWCKAIEKDLDGMPNTTLTQQ